MLCVKALRGDLLLASAYSPDEDGPGATGTLRVYLRREGRWQLAQTIISPVNGREGRPRAVSLDGDRLVFVDARRIYVLGWNSQRGLWAFGDSMEILSTRRALALA